MEAVTKRTRIGRKLLTSVCTVALIAMSVLGVATPDADAALTNCTATEYTYSVKAICTGQGSGGVVQGIAYCVGFYTRYGPAKPVNVNSWATCDGNDFLNGGSYTTY